jgi:hypothetical protein
MMGIDWADADRYNRNRITEDIREKLVDILGDSRMVAEFQEAHGLLVDGKFGKFTRAKLVALLFQPPPVLPGVTPVDILAGYADVIVLADAHPITIDDDGWMQGDDVELIPVHRSWYTSWRKFRTDSGLPAAIVDHYTATAFGSGRSMYRRRQRPLRGDDRWASWHATIEPGYTVQGVPFTRPAWHAGSDTAQNIPDVGWPNDTAAGLEFCGYGRAFPRAQLVQIFRVKRALVRWLGDALDERYFDVAHSWIDPSRRGDPGKVYAKHHAAPCRAYAYG